MLGGCKCGCMYVCLYNIHMEYGWVHNTTQTSTNTQYTNNTYTGRVTNRCFHQSQPSRQLLGSPHSPTQSGLHKRPDKTKANPFLVYVVARGLGLGWCCLLFFVLPLPTQWAQKYQFVGRCNMFSGYFKACGFSGAAFFQIRGRRADKDTRIASCRE